MAKGIVKIYGDVVKGCIFFDGTTVEPKFLGTILAELKSDEPLRLIIYRTDRQDANGQNRQLFKRKKADKIQNQAGQNLVDDLGYTPQQVVDYINEQANLSASVNPVVDTSLNGLDVDFKLDATSTSIIFDNGYQYGVNTIKAVDTGDGLITIKSIEDARVLFTELDHTMVDVNGSDAVGGLNDVINVLNELFTVGAFSSIVISDPYSTMVADVNGVDAGYTLEGADAVDPIGDDIFTYDGSGYANYAGLKSTATIDQAGEYYTFDIRGEGTIGFGLIHTQDSFDNGLYSGNANYANPTSFAAVNSAHYGFQFSHWFHPTPNGSWTNYGANTAYSMRAGWSNFNGTDEQADWLAGNPIKVRCGIDANGYISIETLRNGTDWVVHARSGYPVIQGSEYHLGIKSQSTSARVFTAPKVHLLEEVAPTMYFRYIESPDGVFQYPLFATTEEAEYYDEQAGGSGTYHSHVYADDPTSTTWYMPDTNAVHNGTSAPATDLTLGQPANYTEITSLTNSALVPPAFSSGGVSTFFVNEFESVNYQTQPQDTNYVTTFSGLPNGLINSAGTISGTAPEVTGDNVANPSDTYTVTVTRTNSYGSSNGTVSIIVANLTAPVVTPITGVTDEGGVALIDSDTMDDGSVISIDNVVNTGNRFTFDKEWLDNYVLPKITSGTGVKRVYIGFPMSNANWSTISNVDFLLGYEFYSDDTTRANNNWKLRPIVNGIQQNNIGIGGQTSGLYDYAFINDGADISYGGLVASQGHNISTYVYDTTDSNWKYTGGLSGISSASQKVIIATKGTDMDIDLQYFNEYTEPVAPVGNSTNWTKALDFSGSNEHAKQVASNNYVQPLRLGGYGAQVSNNTNSGKTADSGLSFPFATSIVFKSDFNGSNQHIWNMGEGAGSTDDNMYLRTDSNGLLYFGWGRGGNNNECRLSGQAITGWRGVYIAFKGGRFSSSNATAANLANAFDIRLFNEVSSWAIPSNSSTTNNWISTGNRTDRTFSGDFTIGGRGSNRNFHGKVASMVVTTLRRNDNIPTNTEIELMVTDPVKWVTDYKVGNYYRFPNSTSENPNFQVGDTQPAQATQVWLMGDNASDSYANGMRNYVQTSDQNWTKLQLNSMVSNDIETVNINGLT